MLGGCGGDGGSEGRSSDLIADLCRGRHVNHVLMISGDIGVFLDANGHTDGHTHGRSDPHIEIRGCI